MALVYKSYEYAMGRIRSIEKKMLTRAQLDRMVDSRSPDDALRILAEAEYGSAGDDPEAARDYEILLDNENGKLIGLIKELSPEPALITIFLLKYDYHNIKVLLKGEFSGNTDDSILSGMGNIPISILKTAMLERKFKDFAKEMIDGIEASVDAFNRTSDPQVVDIILDKALYRHMLREANAVGNEFLTGLINSYIDIANISTFVRARAMKKSWEFLRDVLLEGGLITLDVYRENYQESLESFISALFNTPYDELCEEGLKSYQLAGNLTVFERKADDYINDYIKKSKLLSAGMETLISYLVAKQAEIKNARVIMVGKKNSIPEEIIRERLRNTYV